jgi:hypothetical protein
MKTCFSKQVLGWRSGLLSSLSTRLAGSALQHAVQLADSICGLSFYPCCAAGYAASFSFKLEI